MINTALEILMKARLQNTHKYHLTMVPLIMILFWRKQTGKDADLLFTVTVGIPFWGLGEHEPLIIALFLPVVSCSNWRGTWTIKWIDCTYGVARAVDLEFKQEWEHPWPIHMEGKLCQV